MLKHIVLFKLKPSAEGATKEENARKLKALLEALPAKIPQLRKMEVGLNAVPLEGAYDIAIYSEFADQKDLETYMKHPEHLKVVDFVGRVRESRAVVDYVV